MRDESLLANNGKLRYETKEQDFYLELNLVGQIVLQLFSYDGTPIYQTLIYKDTSQTLTVHSSSYLQAYPFRNYIPDTKGYSDILNLVKEELSTIINTHRTQFNN